MSRQQSRFWLYVITLIATSLLVSNVSRADEEKKVVTRSWNLCDFKTDLDGQWQGIIVASDGNCYFAASTHSARSGAMFLKFDPRTQEITVLCDDISRLVGEDPTAYTAQGKIHSAVVESNGWLYFGTHMATYRVRYPGAHLIGYELATGKFRDFGAMEPEYSNYAGVAADVKNDAVFIYVVWPGQNNDKPCYLYRVDVKTGEKRRVGALPPGGWDAAVYFMYADDNGNCWLPAPNGALAKYDLAQDKMVFYPNALPERSEKRFQQWNWSKAIPGQNKALVASYNSLYVFDPETVRFRRIIGGIGQTGLGVDFNGETLYYTTNGQRGPINLFSIDLRAQNPKVVNHGPITDQDGRRPWRIPSLAAGPDGAVYMTGDWHVITGDTQTTRWNGNGYPNAGRAARFSYIHTPKEE